MYDKYDSSQDDDSNASDGLSSKELLKALRAEGLGFIDKVVQHPNCDHMDRPTQRANKSLVPAVRDAVVKGNAYTSWEVFEAVYGGYNRKTLRPYVEQDEWTGEIYLDGKPTNRNNLISRIEGVTKVYLKTTKEQFERSFAPFIEARQFNPIKRYLDSLSTDTPWVGWDTLAKDVLGAEDPLSQEMFTKWLIGAVARAVDPGCQMRQVLTLQGTQEAGKTEFFKALAGKYYTSCDSDTKNNDLYRQLKACWIMELEELEAVVNRKSVEALKQFISKTELEWRPLYQETVQKYPRHSVFGASVNSRDFLRDPSGNSRFWIIGIPGEINVDYVKANRDLIWAEAFRRYQAGEQAWDRELSKQAQERTKEYEVANEYLEIIESKLAHLTTDGKYPIAFSSSDLMLSLGLSITQHGAAKNKVAKALKTLGYERQSFGSSKLYCIPETKPDADVMEWRDHDWVRPKTTKRPKANNL